MVMMNSNRLSELFNDVDLANETDVQELKSLTELYPYYFKPFAVLTKIYLKKQHYRYEELLFKTSLRCNDRAWLHDYLYDIEKTENQDVITAPLIESTDTNTNESELKNSINDFLIDDIPQNQVEEKSVIETENIVEPIESIETSEFITEPKIEINETISNVIEVTEQTQNIELPEISIEVDEIQTLDSEVDHLPLNDINEFLTDENEQIEIESEKPVEFELGIMDNSENINNEIHDQLEEIETEFTLGSKQDVVEEKEAEITQHADIQSLRKNPVYNVESFLNEEIEKEGIENKKITGEKDFFTWLNQPKTPVSEETKEVSSVDKLSIIDKFIELNPQISRPKKEFYNPENMAKKSEQFESLFMTETLANLYFEQGNYSLAIKAYEKLSLQNPEKQTYFASLIEKIKKNK